MMKLLQLVCTAIGPENDVFCQHVTQVLTDHSTFLRFGTDAQISILDAVGYCSLICSTNEEAHLSQFCQHILTTDSVEWTGLPEFALVKAGALRCWSMLTIPNDDVWNHADRFILGAIIELLDSNSVYVVEQCGLSLCRSIETLQNGPPELMIAIQEHITLFLQRANEVVDIPCRSDKHTGYLSLLVKCVHKLYSNNIHNISGLIVADVLHQLSVKSVDRWIQCYTYLGDVICPSTKDKWPNDLPSSVLLKHSHMYKLMGDYQRNLQLEEKQSRCLARHHPHVVTAINVNDTVDTDTCMMSIPLPSKSYQPSVGKSMKNRNLTRHVINREKSAHIRKGRMMKERFQLGDSVITSQFFT